MTGDGRVKAEVVTLPDGEQHKNLEVLQKVWDKALECRCEGECCMGGGGGASIWGSYRSCVREPVERRRMLQKPPSCHPQSGVFPSQGIAPLPSRIATRAGWTAIPPSSRSAAA